VANPAANNNRKCEIEMLITEVDARKNVLFGVLSSGTLTDDEVAECHCCS